MFFKCYSHALSDLHRTNRKIQFPHTIFSCCFDMHTIKVTKNIKKECSGKLKESKTLRKWNFCLNRFHLYHNSLLDPKGRNILIRVSQVAPVSFVQYIPNIIRTREIFEKVWRLGFCTDFHQIWAGESFQFIVLS